MNRAEQKKKWMLTSGAFHRLLEWLDAGTNSDGRNYLEVRRRLVSYFDRKNCRTPEDLADETLNRVARRIEEEGTITGETPAKYCYITARFVFMEYLRGADKRNVSLDEISQNGHPVRLDAAVASSASSPADEESGAKEKMLDCLEKCTNSLDPASREIIVNYYRGAERVKIENRRALARKLDISPNALSIRACRIRDKLEACVGKCVGGD